MGYFPISGPGGSLERLAELSRPHKVFVHINPLLDKDSPEYREVREDAEDG